MPIKVASSLVIFGATGVLAQRMLLPSLFGLKRDALLPGSLRVLGCALTEMGREGFVAIWREGLAEWTSAEKDQPCFERLLKRLDYHAVDLSSESSADALTAYIGKQHGDGDIVFHLSTAPNWYAAICAALGRAGLNDAGSRVMLEKPIGYDCESSVEINDGVAEVFDEAQVYRVDHYLGKDGVQHLLALGFSNALFEPVWNAQHIEQVQITVVHRRMAYERLFLDVIEGNSTLFLRRDEVETAWQWVDDVYAGWHKREAVPKPDQAGSWGPSSVVALTEHNGHSWRE